MNRTSRRSSAALPRLATLATPAAVLLALLAGGTASANDNFAKKPPLTAVPFYTTNFTGPVAVQTAIGHDPTAALDSVVRLFNMSGGPVYPSLYYNPANFRYSHPDWTRANLGPVFGVCLDKRGNIQVTTSRIFSGTGYTNVGAVTLPTTLLNTTGTVYRLDSITGNATILQNLPQIGTGGGLGNICYDGQFDQFFVSNIHDGRIYRLNGTTGAFLSTYDPATGTVVAGGAPLASAVNVYSPLGQRVWGVTRMRDRLYYGKWNSDNSSPGPANVVRSVKIGAGGDFVAGTDQLNYTPPPYIGTTSNPVPPKWNPISDLATSPDGRIAIAERSMFGPTQTGAHDARVLEIQYLGNAWVLSGANTNASSSPNYGMPVGDYYTQTNAAGGVDYDYRVPQPVANQRSLYATSDAQLLQTYGLAVYGFVGMPRVGASALASTNCDYDNVLTTGDKTRQGDVALSAPDVCMTWQREVISCISSGPNAGSYQYTATITNNSPSAINAVSLVIVSGGGSGNPGYINLPLIPPGGSFNVSTVLSGLTPGQTICMQAQLHFNEVEVLCRTQRCFVVAPCDIVVSEPTITATGISCLNGVTSASASILNSTGQIVTGATLTPLTFGITASPTNFAFSPVSPGGSIPLNFTISGAYVGQQVCFLLTLQTPAGPSTTQICYTQPRCRSIGPCRTCVTPWTSTARAIRFTATGTFSDGVTSWVYNDADTVRTFEFSGVYGVLTPSTTGGTTDTILGTVSRTLDVQPGAFASVDVPFSGTDPTRQLGEVYFRGVFDPLPAPGSVDPDRATAPTELRFPVSTLKGSEDTSGPAAPIVVASSPATSRLFVRFQPDQRVLPGRAVKFRCTPSSNLQLTGTTGPGLPRTFGLPFTTSGQFIEFDLPFEQPPVTRNGHNVLIEVDVESNGNYLPLALRTVFVPPTPPAPACLADVDMDGTVDGNDFVLFINSFAIGDPAVDGLADVNHDGTIDGGDFVAFINAFALGC